MMNQPLQTHPNLASKAERDPLEWTRAPLSFRESVDYVAAYLERHPATWYVRYLDGRPCFLAESLAAFRKWLGTAPLILDCRSNEPRGEGWSL